MNIMPHTTKPADWLDQISSAKSVARGGVIGHKNTWVASQVGRKRFEDEVKKRGFHLIDAGPQLIVIRHAGPIKLLFQCKFS